MVNNSFISDVMFIVNDSNGGKEIIVYVYKYVFFVGSFVFFIMFYGVLVIEGV